MDHSKLDLIRKASDMYDALAEENYSAQQIHDIAVLLSIHARVGRDMETGEVPGPGPGQAQSQQDSSGAIDSSGTTDWDAILREMGRG